MQYPDEKIIVTIKNKGKILANANVTLSTDYGELIIKNFMIIRSTRINERLGEPIFIKPPSIGNGYLKYVTVIFEDKKQWAELERLIYSKYIEARSIYGEEVNLNDIPDTL